MYYVANVFKLDCRPLIEDGWERKFSARNFQDLKQKSLQQLETLALKGQTCWVFAQASLLPPEAPPEFPRMLEIPLGSHLQECYVMVYTGGVIRSEYIYHDPEQRDYTAQLVAGFIHKHLLKSIRPEPIPWLKEGF